MRSRIIEGRLDGLDHGFACGWAWRPSDPKLRLRLQLHIDGRFACEGKADQPRPDLVQAGKGDGGYGFVFAIPDRFMDGRSHRVAVVDVDSGATLPGALRRAVLSAAATQTAPIASEPGSVSPGVTAAVDVPPKAQAGSALKMEVGGTTAPEPISSGPSAGGVLEGFKWGRLQGRAADPVQPDRQALVEIRVDGLPEAIVRVEVEEGGGQGGRFAWKPGQHLVDGRAHEVRARVLGEEAELEGSPAVIDFSPPPPVFKCHLAPVKGGKAWGWAWDKADPEARQEVQIFIDGVPAGILVAEEFNEALGRKGIGDAHHGFTWSIDRRYADGREHQISAFVRGVEIGGSPAVFTLEPGATSGRGAAAPAAGPPKAKAPKGSLKGSLDAVTGLQIAGWAADKAKPGARLRVEISIDGKPHAVVLADQFRRSLKERDYPDVRHGFVWTMDRRFADGRPHRLEVKVDGDDLTGSPVIFTLPRAKPLGLPPLTVSHASMPVDGRAAFLSQVLLATRRDVLRERQEILAELAVLARATAAAETKLSNAAADPELEALIKDMAAAVQTLGLKLARD